MEQVLVIDSKDVKLYEYQYVANINELDLTPKFMDRDKAEVNENFLQLIPYIVISTIDGKFVFTYQRGKAGGEERLHGQYTCGLGGHINPEDVTSSVEHDPLVKILKEAAIREVEEEVGCKFGFNDFKLNGFIFSDKTAVDRVHLGVLMMLVLEEEDIKKLFDKGELDTVVNREMKLVSDLQELELENWSRISIDELTYNGDLSV
jgi:predicted NUDIX family phosphoesterase